MKFRVQLLLLGSLVFVSALGLVWSRHEVRHSFMELEYLERDLLNLGEEWGRLLLEHGSWAARGRISNLARERLDMRLPDLQAGTWKVLGGADAANLPEEPWPGAPPSVRE